MIHYRFEFRLLLTFVYVFPGEIDFNKEKTILIINWIFETEYKLSFLIVFTSKKCLEKPQNVFGFFFFL